MLRLLYLLFLSFSTCVISGVFFPFFSLRAETEGAFVCDQREMLLRLILIQ